MKKKGVKMTCCGNKRVKHLTQPAFSNRVNNAPERSGGSLIKTKIFFEYTGQDPVRVVGAVSGSHYRFSQAGARVEIDPRDRRSLAALPNFRQVLRPA